MNMATDDLEIVLGTYENLILGHKVVQKAKSTTLESSFTDDSHRGALRCLVVSPNGVLASSSTDDSIRLHNVRKRKEIGGLFEHSGTVNCIEFFPGGHMFTASEDGTICMWKCKKWEVMKTLKGHKSHVKSLAIHPSGKLALSTGTDKSFLTWDLITGKLAFQRKLQEAAQYVLFASDSDHYVLVYNTKIEVCSLDTKVVKEFVNDWRINTVCSLQDNMMAIGGDSREVLVVDLLKGKTVLTLDAGMSEKSDFNSRVKAICKVERSSDTILIVATSNGIIKGFKIDFSQKSKESVVFFSHETRVRVTCMAVFSDCKNLHIGEKSNVVSQEKAQQSGKGKKIKLSDEDGESKDDDIDDRQDDDDNDSDGENESNDFLTAKRRNESPSSSKFSQKQKRKGSTGEAHNAKSNKKRKISSPPKRTKKKQKKDDQEQVKMKEKKNKL